MRIRRQVTCRRKSLHNYECNLLPTTIDLDNDDAATDVTIILLMDQERMVTWLYLASPCKNIIIYHLLPSLAAFSTRSRMRKCKMSCKAIETNRFCSQFVLESPLVVNYSVFHLLEYIIIVLIVLLSVFYARLLPLRLISLGHLFLCPLFRDCFPIGSPNINVRNALITMIIEITHGTERVF